MENLIVVDIGAANLVAEIYDGREISIYFQDKRSGCVTQDIVTVSKRPPNGSHSGGAVECLVWTDGSSEDYTHSFTIKKLQDEV